MLSFPNKAKTITAVCTLVQESAEISLVSSFQQLLSLKIEFPFKQEDTKYLF